MSDRYRQQSFYQKSEEWADAGYPVRGHVCEGLTRLQALVHEWRSDELKPREDQHLCQCTPNIQPDGYIAGCDDWNKTRIEHCPMCGAALTKDGLEWAGQFDESSY